MFHVYILRCADNSLYVGQTDDLDQRVATHNAGEGALHTRLRRPVRLVYSEEWPSRDDAIERERQLKKWSRKKKEALVAGSLDALHRESRCRTQHP